MEFAFPRISARSGSPLIFRYQQCGVTVWKSNYNYDKCGIRDKSGETKTKINNLSIPFTRHNLQSFKPRQTTLYMKPLSLCHRGEPERDYKGYNRLSQTWSNPIGNACSERDELPPKLQDPKMRRSSCNSNHPRSIEKIISIILSCGVGSIILIQPPWRGP